MVKFLNNNIPIAGQGGRYLLDDAKIIKLFKKGKTINKICNIFGISPATVKRRLRINKTKRTAKYTLWQEAFNRFTNNSCYWAGFLAADAWVGSNHKRKKIFIELSGKDKEHLKKLCRFLKRDALAVKNKTIHRKYKNKNRTYRECVLEVSNKNIVKDLVNNFNIVQNKSLILQSPNKMPSKFIKSFIRGYFDGDGCISRNEYTPIFNIVSGSQNMIKWLSDNIYNNTGMSLNIRSHGIYNIGATGKKAKTIFDWLYAESTKETRLDRKYERYVNYYR